MTNTSRKPTKRDNFNTLLGLNEVASNPQLVEFIEHELDLLNRKNTAERKPSPKQVENAGYKDAILAYLEPDVVYSCADVTKGCPACVEAGLSAQRVSALLGQLAEAGSLTKTVEKRKTFYSLA